MASRPSRNLQVFCVFFVLIAIVCVTPLFVRAYMQSSTVTSTSVSASASPIIVGDSVTFTATVTAATGTPTGLVTFFDGSTPLGSSTLGVVAGSNVASYSTSLLSAVGSPHSITATYQGDGMHDSSPSSAATVIVNSRDTTTGVVLNPSTVVVDQSSTATVTVTDSGSVPPATADTFSATGAPATGRAGATATLFGDGQVLVAGGLSEDGTTVLNTAEIYSVSGGTFSATGTMHSRRLGAVAVLLPNGKVLVAGGTVNINTNSGALNTAELFDPIAGTFSITFPNDQMATARFRPVAALLNNGKVLVAGGLDATGTGLASAELYDPVADTFTATGSMNTARTGATATLLGNGKVLIAGGSSDGTANGALNTAELFDPNANSGAGSFTAITGVNTTLSANRWQPEAALLLSGKVLIAGGQNSGGVLSNADLYDPLADSFTPSNNSMNQARANGSAVSLPNGMVLLAGGTTSQAVDLYDADSDQFDTTGSLQQSDNGPPGVAPGFAPGLISTLLNNGDVLVVGLTTAAPASDAEIYVPSFNPLGQVGFKSSEATDAFGATCVLTPNTSTASTCTATVTPANIATSPHTITSTYPADAVHSGSNNTASLTVNKADTTTTIISSANPSVFGQSVTFTATVSPNAPGAPTGTVTFLDSSSSITTCTGPGTLSGGVATCTTSALSVGNHTVTTSYGGDGNFNGSTGSLTGNPQVVNKADTITTITANTPNPSAVNQPVNITVSVTAKSPGAGTPTGSVLVSDGVGETCTVTSLSSGTGNCSLTPILAGIDTLTAQYNGDGNFNTSSSAGTSQTVVAPPSIAKAFNPNSIPLNGTSTLTFTITNPAANTVAESGVAFSDTLPTGLVVATPNGLTSSCGGTPSATAGGTGISLTGGSIAVNTSCTVVVNVTGTAAGSFTNTSGAVSSTNGGTGNTASDTLIVVAPPSIAKAFSPHSISLNGTSTLTFTITNPAANTVAEAGVAFSDTLPTGLVVATPNGLTNSCGGTPSATAGGTSISLTGGSIAVNSSCTVVVNVTGTEAGLFTNTSGAVSSTNGGTGNTASDTLIVVAPPSIAKAFSPNSIPLNGTSTLTFTITNPVANTVAEAGVAFSDTLPTGLVVATPNGLTNSCGGTPSATAGGTSISLTGASIAVNISCTVVVNVTGTAAGSFTNTSGAISSTNGGTGNTASDTLAVVAPPSIAKAFSPTTVVVNQITTLTFTIKNPSADTLSEAGVAFTDTLPTGLVVATPNGMANSCGGTPSATASGTSINLTGGTVAVNTSCTLAVNVIATASGSYTNTSGSVSSTNGGTGNTATASVTANTRQTNTTVTFSVPGNTVTIATPLTITVTVTDSDANGVALTPAGTVTLGSTVGGDAFSNPGNSCPLASNGLPTGKSSCSVTLTAPHVAKNPHTITANYPVDPQHSASSGSKDLTVNPAHTATVIPSGTILQPAQAFTDQQVTFTSTVSNIENGSIAAPVGTLQFFADGNLIGSAPVAATSPISSSATFTAKLSQIASTPAAGSPPTAHSITTAFIPANPTDADFVGSPSSDSIDMTFAPTITNIPGQTIAPVTFPINPTGATGNITFQCSVLLLDSTKPSPNSPICTLSTTSNGVTATLTTLPASSSMATPGPSFRAANRQTVGFYSLSMPLAIVIGVLLIGRAERKHWSRRKLFGLLGMMLLLSLLVIAAGCGGGFNNANNLQPLGNGTASGQYVISVVGADSSGNVVVVATMQLTVQL